MNNNYGTFLYSVGVPIFGILHEKNACKNLECGIFQKIRVEQLTEIKSILKQMAFLPTSIILRKLNKKARSKRYWRYTNGVHLLDEFNTWLKVHAKINKCPYNTFAFVFFLFQHKHKMIKILLESFVCEIYAKLFKTIKLYQHIKGRKTYRRRNNKKQFM